MELSKVNFMNKEKIDLLFIVESAICKNDGYKARIEMEMGLLKDICNFSILIPWEGHDVSFIQDVKVYSYNALDEKYPFVLNARRLKRKLEEILCNKSDYIICCEALPSAVCSYEVVKKYNCKLIYDCHGTAPDEAYLYHKNIVGLIYANWLRRKQKEIIRKCDLLVTVSNKQYEIFETEKPYVLLPMLPAQQFLMDKNDKTSVRKSLGIPENSIVFCYSGQNQKWQMSEETISYYKKIEDSLPNTFLYILTGSEDAFKEICLKNNIKNFAVKKVPYLEMQYHLDAVDYGFCLRENHIINLVASPTKVLEYLARNVMPILTPYVGDFSKELAKEKLCIVVEDMELKAFNLDSTIDGNKYVVDLIERMKQTYIKAVQNLGEKNV